MAFSEYHFFSSVLGRAVSANVIIPQTPWQPDKTAETPPPKLLYLLHGLSDDYSMWMRRTSIERYADAYNFAVVMPDGSRSFYTDAVAGEQMWTFIAEELPFHIRNAFRVTDKREETFAAGLSMGGYGALKLGLRHPERFAAVAGLSAVTDLKRRFRAADSSSWLPELRRIFGSAAKLAGSGNELFELAQQAVAAQTVLPRIISICGSDDFMIADNRRFNRHMKHIAYPEYHAFERPGSHNWIFWDRYIQDVLEFFTTGKLPE